MRVRFLGRMDMEGWIPYALSSDAIILPSRSEGFPTIVLEAMALGKPVILSDIEVHKRLFSGIAIFYRPGDRESLRKALKNLENFDIPPENLRSIVEKNYDIRVVGERILSVYSDLIGG
jgi:glycosyltransferase involved in cell wall biosynthesis